MMPGGETVTLSNSFGVGNFGGYGNMLPGLMVPQRMMNSSMPMQIQGNKSFFAPSNLSLAPSLGGDGMIQHEPTQTADSELLSKIKDDESDDKISSDNPEGGSGDDQDGGDNRPTKKRYHRHTLHQIQEMEKFFKECPHPDEKQRQELGRELKLSTRQIKFWFQNKRTKMKVHHERHDNGVLRSENEKLKAENFALKEAARNLSCPHCGGPANLAQMSLDEQQLRIENVRLREEIERITSMAAKYIGRQMTPGAIPTSSPSASASGLDMLQGAFPALGSELTSGNLLPDMPPAPHQFGITEMEKPLVMELAVASMEELLHIAQAGEPLWVKDPNGGTIDVLDQDAYLQRFPRGIGVTPAGLKSETSRHTGLVIMNASSLVETFMDVNRWAEMFPSVISRAQMLEMLSTGVGGTYDNSIQLMYSEFQVPSPLIPTREYYFLRYCKRVDHLWVIVDVSIDGLRGNPTQNSVRCRRRPSGCVIQEMPSGYSRVIWVEHVEADTSAVHNLYRSFVSSGMAFGAVRWLCTLQRQCERIASLLASIPPREMSVIPNPEGRRSMLKLAERMTNNFCGGVSASTSHTWVTLSGSGVDDIRVLIRKSVDDPGRPPGIVLSAATSLWLPVPPSKVFQFLRDERYRTEWDILSNTGVVEEMFQLAKGQDPGNCVSLLRVNPISANQNNMLILQECCTDESASYVVYAPIDITTMTTVLNGGDPDSVALLPSGFAILPDGPSSSSALNSIASMGLNPPPPGSSGGSLLTVAFQILVDHVPTAKLSLNSVATVNKLISSTVVRIKSALTCEPA